MSLNLFKLGTRLGAAFALLIMLTVAMGAFALRELAVIHADVEELASNWLPSVESVDAMRAGHNIARRAEAAMLLGIGSEKASDAARQVDASLRDHEVHDTAYRALISSAQEQALYDGFRSARGTYLQAVQQLRALSVGSDASASRAQAYYIGESEVAFEAMMVPLRKLVEINHQGADAARIGSRATYEQAQFYLRMALAGVALAALALAVLVTRSVTRPLANAIAVSERVAAGDLARHVHAEGRDEVAQLLRALAAMQQSLADTVKTVRGNAESVATASAEIAQGNGDLSHRTEEQASALQQTAATMEQLSSTVRNNADNAQQANELAQRAAQVADEGGQVVRAVVEKMQRIEEGSSRIADITGVIDGIAFQTNILALNAAVEAARAGEQGRGFAVVAGEVRALAQRSAEAAKEIRALITASAGQVHEGAELVAQAGRTMEEVVASIRRVNDIAAEISAASREQSDGVGQVGEAVAQMDQVTQQNAALVEESAAAAGSLKTQAEALVRAVAVFRLAGDADASVRAPVAPQRQALTAKRPSVMASPVRPRLAAAGSDWAPF